MSYKNNIWSFFKVTKYFFQGFEIVTYNFLFSKIKQSKWKVFAKSENLTRLFQSYKIHSKGPKENYFFSFIWDYTFFFFEKSSNRNGA